ncbi:MAG: flagellar motor switch protein FliN [Planctomycetia bacterium]|nr:MAG: flagellar motor switch protein FliN [Planctomycetia bacterium]
MSASKPGKAEPMAQQEPNPNPGQPVAEAPDSATPPPDAVGDATSSASTMAASPGAAPEAVPASGKEATAPARAEVGGGAAMDLPEFEPDRAAGGTATAATAAIDLLNDVELNVTIELGRAQMLIEEVLKLGEGSVVELDKLAGDPVDVLVNDRLVARGEVLVLNDNFCVRISEIITPDLEHAAN